MNITSMVLEIQYVLAPAVMVSSAALLLLGFQGRFSNLASRFRSLNHERRLLLAKHGRDQAEEARFHNVNEQIESLMKRAGLVKNVILLTYASIACFSGTSVLIFLNLYAPFKFYFLIIAAFITGFILLLFSIVEMMREIDLFHRVIELEKQS